MIPANSGNRMGLKSYNFSVEFEFHTLELTLKKAAQVSIGVARGPQKVTTKPIDFNYTKREQLLNQKVVLNTQLYLDTKKLTYQEKLVRVFVIITSGKDTREDGQFKVDLASYANLQSSSKDSVEKFHLDACSDTKAFVYCTIRMHRLVDEDEEDDDDSARLEHDIHDEGGTLDLSKERDLSDPGIITGDLKASNWLEVFRKNLESGASDIFSKKTIPSQHGKSGAKTPNLSTASRKGSNTQARPKSPILSSHHGRLLPSGNVEGARSKSSNLKSEPVPVTRKILTKPQPLEKPPRADIQMAAERDEPQVLDKSPVLKEDEDHDTSVTQFKKKGKGADKHPGKKEGKAPTPIRNRPGPESSIHVGGVEPLPPPQKPATPTGRKTPLRPKKQTPGVHPEDNDDLQPTQLMKSPEAPDSDMSLSKSQVNPKILAVENKKLLEELNAKTADLEQVKEEKDDIFFKYKGLERDFHHMRSQNDQWKKDLDEMKSLYTSLKLEKSYDRKPLQEHILKESKYWEDRIKAANEEIENLRRTVDEYASENDHIKSENSELKKSFVSPVKAKTSPQATQDGGGTKPDHVQETQTTPSSGEVRPEIPEHFLSELEDLRVKIANAMRDNSQLNTELETLRKDFASAQQRVSTVMDEKAKLEKENQGLNQTIKTIRESNVHVDQELTQLKASLEELQRGSETKQDDEVEALKKEKHELQQRVSLLEEARPHQEGEVAELQQEISALKLELNEKHRLTQQLEEEGAQHLKQIESLKTENEALAQAKTEMKDLEQKVQELNGKVIELEQVIESKDDEISHLKETLQKAESDMKDLSRQKTELAQAKADLQKEISELRRGNDTLLTEKDSALQRVMNMEADLKRKDLEMNLVQSNTANSKKAFETEQQELKKEKQLSSSLQKKVDELNNELFRSRINMAEVMNVIIDSGAADLYDKIETLLTKSPG